MQLAIARAEIALEAAIIQPVPVLCRVALGHADRLIHQSFLDAHFMPRAANVM
jgi:hypothetical protein